MRTASAGFCGPQVYPVGSWSPDTTRAIGILNQKRFPAFLSFKDHVNATLANSLLLRHPEWSW